MSDEIVRGMMNGDMFVDCLYTISSMNPETGETTQRLL